MIKATGGKNGERLTVTFTGDGFLFNGKENYEYEAELITLLEDGEPIGGTYYPENVMGDLNIINVLSNRFFDKVVDVEADTEEEIPNESGVIY